MTGVTSSTVHGTFRSSSGIRADDVRQVAVVRVPEAQEIGSTRDLGNAGSPPSGPARMAETSAGPVARARIADGCWQPSRSGWPITCLADHLSDVSCRAASASEILRSFGSEASRFRSRSAATAVNVESESIDSRRGVDEDGLPRGWFRRPQRKLIEHTAVVDLQERRDVGRPGGRGPAAESGWGQSVPQSMRLMFAATSALASGAMSAIVGRLHRSR